MTMDDPYTVKTVRAIYPRIDGTSGCQVSIEVGAAMTADTLPTWSAPVVFNVGVDNKINSTATGRFLSVRFSDTGFPPWRIRSFDIEYVLAGAD